MPFDDAMLLKAPLEGPYGILTACREVLHEIDQERIYDHHKGSEDPKNFNNKKQQTTNNKQKHSIT